MNYAKRFIQSKTHMKAVMIAIALVFAISVSAIGYDLLSDEDASYADTVADYVQDGEGDGEGSCQDALDYGSKDYDTDTTLVMTRAMNTIMIMTKVMSTAMAASTSTGMCAHVSTSA